MTPTERRALHPAAIVEAWEWVDVYCPHYATQGREQALDLLVLLSALESAFMASKATIPDYLLERIGDSVEMLRGEVLT